MKQRHQVTPWGSIDWLQADAPEDQVQPKIAIVNVLPWQGQAEHIHHSDIQFLYTLEGTGEHVMDGKHYPIQPGDYFFFPMGVRHVTVNRSDRMLKEFLVSIPSCRARGSEPQAAVPVEKAPDREFVHRILEDGIRRLQQETLDHLSIPIVITDDQQNIICQNQLSLEHQCCSSQNCPVLAGTGESMDSCSTVVCHNGVSVLIQPIVIDGLLCYYVKGVLIEKNGDQTSLAAPAGITAESVKLLLKDISYYLQNYYRERKIEREFLLRNASMAAERQYDEGITRNMEQSKDDALNIQIRTHFLFNALNSIASLAVRDGSMDTYKAIIDLAELLRGMLRREGTRVPLSEEISFLQRYLRLQELRHEGSLRITWQRSARAEKVIVPHNFLQLIVENSFRHAFLENKGCKELVIETKVEENRAVICLKDNGCGMDEKTLQNLRSSLYTDQVHGLPMAFRKLAGVYGTDFTFDITSKPGCGTEFRLTFPL